MLTDFEANPARLAALTDLTRVHEPTQGPVSQLGDSVHRRLNFYYRQLDVPGVLRREVRRDLPGFVAASWREPYRNLQPPLAVLTVALFAVRVDHPSCASNASSQLGRRKDFHLNSNIETKRGDYAPENECSEFDCVVLGGIDRGFWRR